MFYTAPGVHCFVNYQEATCIYI